MSYVRHTTGFLPSCTMKILSNSGVHERERWQLSNIFSAFVVRWLNLVVWNKVELRPVYFSLCTICTNTLTYYIIVLMHNFSYHKSISTEQVWMRSWATFWNIFLWCLHSLALSVFLSSSSLPSFLPAWSLHNTESFTNMYCLIVLQALLCGRPGLFERCCISKGRNSEVYVCTLDLGGRTDQRQQTEGCLYVCYNIVYNNCLCGYWN